MPTPRRSERGVRGSNGRPWPAALTGAQEAADVGFELGDIDGAAFAQGVGLDVLVEALGGVELGAVAGQEVQLDELGVLIDQPRTIRARCAGCPSMISMILRPLASRTSRLRKSRNTGPVNFSSKSRKRSVPVFEIVAIMFARKRSPVALVIGVCPTGAHVRPAVWSERRPDSSSTGSRRARGALASRSPDTRPQASGGPRRQTAHRHDASASAD
jgi:hypothetical protein